jgi:hypothetical protein
MRGASRNVFLAVMVFAFAPGCDKKDDASATTPTAATATAAAATALAPSVADPAAKALKFAVDADGKMAIDMPAPIQHIKADTSAAAGSLDVDLKNVASSRGQVKVDLATLKTHTFGDDRDSAQSEHASTWLEVNEKTSPKAADNRWAVFAIRTVDGVSAPDVTKVAPVKEGSDDVRSVTLTAHGDFLLHGHTVPKDAALEVKFHYPSGAAPDSSPTRVDIRSKAPLHVVLAEHDVKPRDDKGILAQKSLSLLGTKVAETADVTIDLHASPAQ